MRLEIAAANPTGPTPPRGRHSPSWGLCSEPAGNLTGGRSDGSVDRPGDCWDIDSVSRGHGSTVRQADSARRAQLGVCGDRARPVVEADHGQAGPYTGGPRRISDRRRHCVPHLRNALQTARAVVYTRPRLPSGRARCGGVRARARTGRARDRGCLRQRLRGPRRTGLRGVAAPEDAVRAPAAARRYPHYPGGGARRS